MAVRFCREEKSEAGYLKKERQFEADQVFDFKGSLTRKRGTLNPGRGQSGYVFK